MVEADRGMEKEKIQLVESIKNIKQQISEMDKKQKKFGAQSARTRTEMAKMMKDEAYRMIQQIAENDKVLETFYLRRPLPPRRESVVSSVSRSMLSRIQGHTHSAVALPTGIQPTKKRTASKSSRTSSVASAGSLDVPDKRDSLRKIMLILIDKADFLVDEDLNAMMELLPNQDKLLVKVDNILDSLKVQRPEDLERMVEHLKNLEDKEGRNDSVYNAEKRSKVRFEWYLSKTYICLLCSC